MPDSVINHYEDVHALSRAAADGFVSSVKETLRKRDRFRIALAGGSTPKTLYQLLAQQTLPWDQIEWFWGDERNVPMDHPDSNAKMVYEALLNHIDVPESNIHPVPVQVDQPQHTARAYEATLRDHFASDKYPNWDLVLLGLGSDGHTASLFPHTPALTVTDQWFVANPVESMNTTRYTLTVPAINSGRQIWFLVAGANKADALQVVLSRSGDPDQYPAQRIQPTRWLVTRDAVRLSKHGSGKRLC